MATARLYNLARMTTATTGTGTVTLGSAVTGFLTFAQSGVEDGATVSYAIKDGNNSEQGRGVYTAAGPTLTRATVLNSTNSNNALNLTGSAEVFITPAGLDYLPAINAQTGTTYTVLATDLGKLVTLSNAAAIAVTLPQATALFGAGWYAYVRTSGAGTVTITPTTSTINGAATLVLPSGAGAILFSDGTNWQAIQTSSNQFAAGAEATPSITFAGDTNTGFWSPAADTLAVSTGGSERVRIDSSGNVGIGISAPQRLFHVGAYSGSNEIQVGSGTASHGAITFGDGTVGDASYRGFVQYNHATDSLALGAAGGAHAALTSAGNLQFNSGYGSVATAYGCRAWVNFDGTGTVAIRDSGNVSSITDNGTGNYTVNFTTAMPDTNYAVCAMFADSGGGIRTVNGTYATTSVDIRNFIYNTGTAYDGDINSVAIFR